MLRFIGIKELNIIERLKLFSLTRPYYKKLRTYFKNPELIIRIKKYNKEGKQKKFSIHSRINAQRLLLTSQSADWDLPRAIHKNFNKFLKEIENKFEKPRIRRPQR